MTYESASEAEVLKSYWRPGAALENTVFALLDPDGNPLTRSSRSPSWFFRDSSEMARALVDVASHYRSNGQQRDLPIVSTVRLGMSVAACDKLPLVIVISDRSQERQAMERALAPLSWSDYFVGKLTYTAGNSSETRNIKGVQISKGYLFVSPDEFGTTGKVVTQLYPSASQKDLQLAMRALIDRHHPLQLDHREHIRWGREQGIYWETAIPVTDPHSPEAGTRGVAHSGAQSRGPQYGGYGSQNRASQYDAQSRSPYSRGQQYGDRADPHWGY